MIAQTKYVVIYFVIVIEFTLGGFVYNKCNKQTHKNCGNIYVWTPERNDFVSLVNMTYHKPNGDDDTVLQGREIRVLVCEMYPYVMYDRFRNQLNGFIGDFWKALQIKFKFINKVIIENNFDVALDRMVNGEADIFLGAVVSNDKLNNATFYSQPYFLNWYSLSFREPDESGSSDFFVHAFQRKFLLTTVMVYLFLAFLLWIGLKIMIHYHPDSTQLPLISCILFVVGGFLNQTHALNIKSTSIRIIIIVSLLFGYILCTSLNAVLVSMLTNLNSEHPIESLDDAAIKRTHSLCVRNNSFVYNYFLDENKEVLPKWEKIVNGPHCLDIKDIDNLAEIICNPNVIILENRPIFASIFNRYPVNCNVRFLPGQLFLRYNFIVYHKSFAYQYLISRGMKQIKSSGIMAHLEQKWFDIKTSFNADKTNGALPAVNLMHVGGVLIMLLGSIFLSVLILGCELMFWRMVQRYK